MPTFSADRVASLLNSRMAQSNRTKSLDTTVHFNGVPLQAPRPRSNIEMVKHSRERYASKKAIAEADVAILRFT